MKLRWRRWAVCDARCKWTTRASKAWSVPYGVCKTPLRYCPAQLLRPHNTCLFSNKNIELIHQDLEKPLEPNGAMRLHHFSVKMWNKHLLVWEGLKLQAHVCQYVLGSDLFPSSTPSLWLPNNCTWFVHPFWRFKGCCCCFPPPKQLLFSTLNNLQKAKLWLASHTDCKGSGGERLWGETRLGKSRAHKLFNMAFNKYCSMCLMSLRKAVGRWHSLTQAVLNSALCASDMSKGLIRPSGCREQESFAPSCYQSSSIFVAFLWIASHNEHCFKGGPQDRDGQRSTHWNTQSSFLNIAVFGALFKAPPLMVWL